MTQVQGTEQRETDEEAAEVFGWRAEHLFTERVTAPTSDARFDGHGRRVLSHDTMMQPTLKRAALPFARFDKEARSATAICDRVTVYETPQDRYLTGPHTTPNEDCQCGYRIATDPEELVRMVRQQARDMERYYGVKRSLGFAFCGVVGYGTVFESVDHEWFEDPPGTWRVSNYALTGPILLPATGQGRSIKPLLRRFTVPLDVQYVPPLHKASRADVTELLDVMYDADEADGDDVA